MFKNKKEGYLLIDHTASPGVPGLPRHLEVATIKCQHCERQIVRNPSRVRPRAHCWGCDRDICDQCAVLERIHGCKPFSAIIEKQLTNFHKGVILNG